MTEQAGPPETAVTLDVVIPVLNEAHVLAKSVATVREFCAKNLPCRWRVVVADNGSTDGTDKIAEQLAAQHSDVHVQRLDVRGRGRALRAAWTSSKADIVCYMDVDLSTELAALPRSLNAIVKEGYDIAIGSRLMRESKTTRSPKREFISQAYNIFVKLVLQTGFSDAQCGFKMCTRRVVNEIVPQVEDQSWFFDTELLVLAEKQGYRIKDLAVVWIEDDDSRVKIIQTAWDDIKGVLRLRRLLWARSREFAAAREANGKRGAFPKTS
jgi:glycosyltransferase involved in cell wall biosynthesis